MTNHGRWDSKTWEEEFLAPGEFKSKFFIPLEPGGLDIFWVDFYNRPMNVTEKRFRYVTSYFLL